MASSLPTRINKTQDHISWKCGLAPGQVSAEYVADKDQGTKGRDRTTGGPSDKKKKQKNEGSNEGRKKYNIDAKWKRKHHGIGRSTHVREPGQQRTKSKRTRKKQQIRATLGKRKGESARRPAKRLAVGRAATGDARSTSSTRRCPETTRKKATKVGTRKVTLLDTATRRMSRRFICPKWDKVGPC